jgi:glutamate synthase domain-containing protein 3
LRFWELVDLSKEGLELRTLVKEYVLVKGNHEATEILEDYVKYIHKLGYVIRRQPKLRRRTNSQREHAKKRSVQQRPSIGSRV